MTDADANIPEQGDPAVEPEMKDLDAITDGFIEQVIERGKTEVPPEPRQELDVDLAPPELPTDDIETLPLEEVEPASPELIAMAHAELDRVVEEAGQDDWNPAGDELPEMVGEPVEHAALEIRTADGLEMSQGPDGTLLVKADEDEETQLVGGGDEGFWAKITDNAAADGTPQNRWDYAWSEVTKSTGGYDGWSVLSGGRSGTTSTGPARNTIEDMNTAADAASPTIQGNGVDIDGTDFPAGFAVMPAPDNVIVWMREVSVVDGTTEYWFQYENAVDGTCT